MNAGLIRGDALRLPLRDASVDLVVTSPPYWALRSYTDAGEHYDGQIGSEDTPAAFLAALWAVLDECWRVLKPTGSVFVNLGDKYAGSGGHNNAAIGGTGRGPSAYNRAADVPPKSLMLLPEQFRLGAVDPSFRAWKTGLAGPQWIARSVVIWDKPNGLPESVTDRVRRSHEDWVHLTKQGRYFAAVDEIREAHADPSRQGTHNGNAIEGRSDGVSRDRGWQAGLLSYNPLGKLPGSVWEVLDYAPWEKLILSGQLRFCPKCGRDLTAGNGRATATQQATAELPGQTDLSSTSTGLPTNCSEDPFPTGSLSTTCVATPDAATPHTLSSSPEARTSDGAASHSKPTASTDTASPTPTSNDDRAGQQAVDAARADLSECVCFTLGSPLTAKPSVWTVPSEPLRVPEWLGVDHFAAFPQEFPRRIILGWSPSGYCTACDQPRTAVVDAKRVKPPAHGDGSITGNRNGGPDERRWDGAPRFDMERTITGYACACPDTLAPTRPAVILDPFSGTGTTVMVARALGRYGVGVDLSADYLRLARWRIFDSGHAAKTIRRTNEAAQLTMLA